jgi:hypothetical protein
MAAKRSTVGSHIRADILRLVVTACADRDAIAADVIAGRTYGSAAA